MVNNGNTLKNRLNENNGDSIPNIYFEEFADHISINLIRRKSTGGKDYSEGPDKTLLALCRNHSIEYQKPYGDEKSTVILTHPFYLYSTHIDKIDNDNLKKEAEEYLDTLFNFLNLIQDLNLDGPKVSVVVLETIHHYTASTSFLLEEGLIDQVIFTEYDHGYPLDTNELIRFRGNNIFFGGGYNGNNRCLPQSIKEMKKKYHQKIYGL